MFYYNIINLWKIHFKDIKIKKILKSIDEIIQKEQRWTLNIIFIDKKWIRKFNKQYRNINKSTDVLSFHYFDDFFWLYKHDIAWDIFMCEDKIVLQSKKYLISEEMEFYKLLIHSVLHILWYDHEKDEDYKIMQKKENIIWEDVFEKKEKKIII